MQIIKKAICKLDGVLYFKYNIWTNGSGWIKTIEIIKNEQCLNEDDWKLSEHQWWLNWDWIIHLGWCVGICSLSGGFLKTEQLMSTGTCASHETGNGKLVSYVNKQTNKLGGNLQYCHYHIYVHCPVVSWRLSSSCQQELALPMRQEVENWFHM